MQDVRGDGPLEAVLERGFLYELRKIIFRSQKLLGPEQERLCFRVRDFNSRHRPEVLFLLQGPRVLEHNSVRTLPGLAAKLEQRPAEVRRPMPGRDTLFLRQFVHKLRRV